MDNKYTLAVSELMTAVTTLTGLQVIWKDAGGSAEPSLPRKQCLHCNPFCARVKAAAERIRRCSINDTVTIESLATFRRRPFIHRCHAGADELITPIFFDGVYTGAFFLGPFRRRNAICAYPSCKNEFAGLPEYRPAQVAAAGRILRLLEFAAGQYRQTLAIRQSLEDESCQRLRPALEYMDRHFRQPLTASSAAAACHLSTSRFIHLFKEKFKIGFSEYLLRRRMEEAKLLLTGTEMKIGDVAFRCGFQNQSYFGMVFRRNTGNTPAAYRIHFRCRREP
ncbi:MAG: helix-turn-helix domain-containing protein [Victivallaceae bacterium]|jgi:AraC-like DNA-binding protein